MQVLFYTRDSRAISSRSFQFVFLCSCFVEKKFSRVGSGFWMGDAERHTETEYTSVDTYKRCSGIEERPTASHKQNLHLAIDRKFRKLITPISSHLPITCCLFNSTRVGAAKHCIHTLLAESKRVLSILIPKWVHVKTFFMVEQDPL